MTSDERPPSDPKRAEQPTIVGDLNAGPGKATQPTMPGVSKPTDLQATSLADPALASQQQRSTQATMIQGDAALPGSRTQATHLHVAGETPGDRVDGTHRGEVWGDFRLGDLLGRGGMGAVYRGIQVSLDRPVAVKVLPPHLSQNENFRSRFQLEAKAVAKLNSSHVIQVYGAGVHDGQHYFAMEYVEGEDLAHKLHGGFKPSYAQALGLITQATRGLAAAGELGIIHRDIKPGNMMVTAKGVLKIMDFGLVKLASEDHSMTLSGTIMGTVTYFSPEQGRGDRCDQRTDIYALGVVFYELLTGKLPFSGGDATSIIYQHIHAAPKPPKEIDPHIPEAYQAVALKCMQKRAEDRYQSAAELLSDLQRLEAGAQPAIALQDPHALRHGATVMKSPPFRAERRRGWIVGAIAAAAAIAVAALAVQQLRPKPLDEDPVRTGARVPHIPVLPTAAAIPAQPRFAVADGRALLDAGKLDEAKTLVDNALRNDPTDQRWLELLATIDQTRGKKLLASAQDAFAKGDYDSAGSQAAAASALLQDAPELKKLEDDLAAIEGTRKQRKRSLAEADSLLGSGDFAKAEDLLKRLDAENPNDQTITAALARARALRENAQAVATAAREEIERGNQALERNDLESALLAFTSAKQFDPRNSAASDGLARVNAIRQQISEIRKALDTALKARDLVAAEKHLAEMRTVAPGSSALVLAESALASSRLAEEEKKRQAEEHDAKLSQESKNLIDRIADPKQDIAVLERDVAAFTATLPAGRPERTLLERRLEDHRQRSALSVSLASLDAALASKSSEMVAKVVTDSEYAEALRTLWTYQGLVFETTLVDFLRADDRTATAKVRIRHALAVFPERTLEYVYDLKHGDHGWQIASAHLQAPAPAR
ncbi:MAG: protein kinase [Planctomycetes bacterium]|nr:protein kinase [Planctomycetota bacterium]